MRGELATGTFAKRHPLDWYVEQGWEWEQIVGEIGLREQDNGSAIWDPAAGYGHSASRLQSMGFTGMIMLGDLVNNVAWDDFERPQQVLFGSEDFLELKRQGMADVSIWSNPPYSYKQVIYDGRQVSISEAFVRHALKLASDRVVMILPAKWLAMGKRRSRLVRIDHPPQFVLHFCERPSMPPGDRIHLMGARAYRGGMVDYCAIVWDVRAPTLPGDTRVIWLPPLGGA